MQSIKKFTDTWEDNETGIKKVFTEFLEHLSRLEKIEFEFNARPGVSYSLRPKRNDQTKRNLFAMVDIIDDNPTERWLSICFYGEMISDPDQIGNLIPGGLLGEDGYCFDLDEYNADEIEYLKQRLTEAYENARE